MAAEPMRVAEIWRYPVKSLQGERLESANAGERGIEGDRTHAIWDLETDLGLTARRVPELLFAHAALQEDGSVRIKTPDGAQAADDKALSDWLGRRVELRSGSGSEERRYESPTDFERERAESWREFSGSLATYHDDEDARLSLISTGTLRPGWDRRRFRTNIVLDGEGELELCGDRVQVGQATFEVGEPIVRCVMVTRPQPGGLDRDLDVMRTIARDHDNRLAVAAKVVHPGTLAVGDLLQLA